MAVVTAISAFYLPALLMVALYYQVYKGLQKRQRHLKSVSVKPDSQQQAALPRTTLEAPTPVEEHHFDELSIEETQTESTLVPTRNPSGRESALSLDNTELARHPTDDSLDQSDSLDNSANSSKRKNILLHVLTKNVGPSYCTTNNLNAAIASMMKRDSNEVYHQ